MKEKNLLSLSKKTKQFKNGYKINLSSPLMSADVALKIDKTGMARS